MTIYTLIKLPIQNTYHTWYLKNPDLLDEFIYKLDGNAKWNLRIAVFYKETPGHLLCMRYDPDHQNAPVFVGKDGLSIEFENAWDAIKGNTLSTIRVQCTFEEFQGRGEISLGLVHARDENHSPCNMF